MQKYDPVFAERPVPNHEGECQFVRLSHYFEQCKLKDCPVGRYSREWLASMGVKSATAKAVVEGSALQSTGDT